VFGGVSKPCEPVQDVEPLQYFTWPHAIVEFEIKDEATLMQSSLTIHVKDSDTLRDRYIGGAMLPLAPLFATKQGNVLCQGKFIPLEYADEKFKTKKDSGEVKLSITVIDTLRPSAPPTAAEQPATMAKPAVADVVTAPPTLVPRREPPQQPQLVPVIEGSTAENALVPAVVASREEAAKASSSTLNPTAESTPLEPQAPDNSGQSSTTTEKNTGATEDSLPVYVKTLQIELVSARQLTRPTSIGSFLDRKPDPMVTLEFYGMVRTSAPLKNVDLAKPVAWSNTMCDFPLSTVSPPPKPRKGIESMDLQVHVKDDNLMKATYMGGGKLDLSEFFQPRTS
jgi:hypothetical protein